MKYDDGSGYYAKNGFPPRKKFTSKSKDTGLCDTLLVFAEAFIGFFVDFSWSVLASDR